jgi:hypothetical protein
MADRAKIIDGAGAKFVATLAAIAQLKCGTEAAGSTHCR